MRKTDIWIIDHKATLGEYSPLNIDGSTWILGVCTLNATDQEEALAIFAEYLKKKKMELIEIYEIALYNANNFTDDSKRTENIQYAARRLGQNNEIYYVYARTSESLEDTH